MFRHVTLAIMFILAGCVAIPTKSETGILCAIIVQDAIRYYDQAGYQATINYYSSPESLDGPWYVFIPNENQEIVAHYSPETIGAGYDARTDSTGYFFGDDMASATEEGKGISYVWLNP